jgi:hypothetical protein
VTDYDEVRHFFVCFLLSSYGGLALEVITDKSHKAKYAFWDFPLMLVGPVRAASAFLLSSYGGLALEVIS